MGKESSPFAPSSGFISARDALWQEPSFGKGADALDLSQTVFHPGNLSRAAELLQALPLVKGAPVQVDVGDGALTATVLKLTRKNAAASGAASYIYTDLTTLLNEGPKAQADPTPPLTTELPFVRLGLRVAAPRVDSTVAPSASKDAAAWRVEASATELLAELDKGLGQNLVDGPNTVFKGLPTLSTAATGVPVNFADAAVRLLTQTLATGRGAGEGGQCLLGNEDALRSLALSATSQTNGACGWREDARTGLWVFHFMGTPFYRVNTANAGATTTLYAANLGPTGLQLVHAYGSAQTFGLQVDEEPTQTSTATRGLVVHGAWCLALWEPRALRHFANLTFTP
ncbi:MAG: hypothetical protein HY909_29130 [Deltaproteobacteria bacterium]|nr:hypothetical protein [Deltaproteobacteria bacterium]